jgi:carbon-monoxide dehydrogenase large subunit
MPGSILGTSVRRVEDPDLLVGAARFVDDLPIDGALHLVFVRSTSAHARIEHIDTADAKAMPGVKAVFVAADLNLPRYEGLMVLNEQAKRPPLTDDKVRFVGDTIAAVVAETRTQAVDAAEAVIVEYDPLPAVVDPEAALAPDAPLQFDELGTNLAAAVTPRKHDDVLADAEVVVRARIENQRIAVMPMEGNAIAVDPTHDDNGHVLTVYVSTQMPHGWADKAAPLFGLEPRQIRVIAPHVGGAFGGKPGLATEHMVVVAAAQRLQRPVKWIETRSENLIGMPHGRGQIQYAELGCTRDGTITGLKLRIIGDAGAYAGFGGALPMGPTRTMAQGVYRIPKISYEAAVALTNTTPMGAFRGAGRPEAAALLERMMDLAAVELNIDPIEMRRRNFITPDEFPFTTVMRGVYDSGDYDLALTTALEEAGYDALRKEQRARRANGERTLLGIGVSAYVEITAGGGGGEYARVTVDAHGDATIHVGTSAHGQGHATTFAMIVADRLHLPLERVHFVQSDTARVPEGGGTGGSRSLQLGGSAVFDATEKVLTQAKQKAATLLEANPDDIVLTDDGRIGVAGVPAHAITWANLARDEPIDALAELAQDGPTFPFGAHVAVVEVDLDTGLVTPIQHVAVDDCGRIVNPLLVAGQQHGGIAQGIAQALWEHYVYDDEGNPLTANLLDYAMPSAAELPSFDATNTETPSPRNPLGAKGIGESGTIGSTPAVQSAVVDALRHLGIRHLDIPCTPERVWRAIRDAEQGRVADPWREPPPVFAATKAPEHRADAEAIDI